MKRSLRIFVIAIFSLISSIAWAASVDINTADAPALSAAIDGVGEKRAQAIVDYREANGPFSSVDDLVKVKGIGSATLEKNRDNLIASDSKK